LSRTVIYKDIENYDSTNDPQCGPAVSAFVGAWVSELHKKGYSAGVYANPAPAAGAVSQASPLPDEVWICKWDSRATTWGLGDLNDIEWTTDQRMHQFQAQVSDTWGGVTYAIDRDIEDAPVAGSNGAKSYTFTFSTFGGGFLNGINDVVSSSGQLTYTYSGQLAGENCGTGQPCSGFLYDPNTGSSPFMYSALSEANGANNQDEIVGDWNPYISGAVYWFHGLIYENGAYTTTDFPGTTGGTVLRGINDDGQSVGFYYYSSGSCAPCTSGFLRNSDGTFVNINYPSADSTRPSGINGSGQIAGWYSD